MRKAFVGQLVELVQPEGRLAMIVETIRDVKGIVFVLFARSREPAVLMAAAEIYGGQIDQSRYMEIYREREQVLQRDHFQLFMRFQGGGSDSRAMLDPNVIEFVPQFFQITQRSSNVKFGKGNCMIGS